MSIEKPIIVIPALNPDERLIDYVKELVVNGFDKVLLVNDGSDDKRTYIFDLLTKEYGCMLYTHYVNMGKGRALKNALNYCLTSLDMSRYSGIVTVDSDGQHAVKDVKRIAEMLGHGSGKRLILGARDFDNSNVPGKSRIGNKITRSVLKILFGGNISDTQTGLRGIRKELISEFLTLKGERFEYETTVLIECLKRDIVIEELVIDTIYENDNKGTHFRPIKDSMIIYSIILTSFTKYVASSLIAAGVDLSVFKLLMLICVKNTVSMNVSVWISTIVARVLSSIFNFCINRNIVFENKEHAKINRSLLKYYMLAVMQMICSACFVYVLSKITQRYMLVKIIVDTVLFGVSYCVQQRWVFRVEIKE